MTEIIAATGVLAFIIYAGYNISYIMSMKRTSDTLYGFVKNTEGNLNATLAELKGTLENLKKITGDFSVVTDDVRQITATVASVDRSVRNLYGIVKKGLGPAAEANIAGLKAGIKAGVVTLVRNLQEGRSDGHERRTGEK